MKARLNGVNHYFDIEGAGLVPIDHQMHEKPACFVLHGGPALDHTYFKPWLSPLADVLQLIYIDHRGTGRSDEASLDSYRLPVLADDLEKLRIYLGLERVAVMGSSYGGFLALEYATRYPNTLSLLFLLGTSPSHRFWERAQELLDAGATPEQRDLGPQLLDGKITTPDAYSRWWKTMLPLYFYDYDAALGERIVSRITGNVTTSREMLANDLPAYDVEAKLRTIAVPTFVAAGRVDWIQPLEQAEILVREIPNAELTIYEKSGHFMFIEEHEAFLADVRSFVHRHAA